MIKLLITASIIIISILVYVSYEVNQKDKNEFTPPIHTISNTPSCNRCLVYMDNHCMREVTHYSERCNICIAKCFVEPTTQLDCFNDCKMNYVGYDYTSSTDMSVCLSSDNEKFFIKDCYSCSILLGL